MSKANLKSIKQWLAENPETYVGWVASVLKPAGTLFLSHVHTEGDKTTYCLADDRYDEVGVTYDLIVEKDHPKEIVVECGIQQDDGSWVKHTHTMNVASKEFSFTAIYNAIFSKLPETHHMSHRRLSSFFRNCFVTREKGFTVTLSERANQVTIFPFISKIAPTTERVYKYYNTENGIVHQLLLEGEWCEGTLEDVLAVFDNQLTVIGVKDQVNGRDIILNKATRSLKEFFSEQ